MEGEKVHKTLCTWQEWGISLTLKIHCKRLTGWNKGKVTMMTDEANDMTRESLTPDDLPG
jgi:hypothetical protein